MNDLRKENDRKYMVYASRKVKAISRMNDIDRKNKDLLFSIAKEILDISSRMIEPKDIISKTLR